MSTLLLIVKFLKKKKSKLPLIKYDNVKKKDSPFWRYALQLL